MTKKLGDLTVRELWEICDTRSQCVGCPIWDKICVGGAWPRSKKTLEKEVDL